MFLYIRHAKDKEDKDGNDGSLRKSSKEEINKKTLIWIEKYGIPEIVYYSPFYRTFQTVKQIKRCIEDYMKKNNIQQKIKYIVEPKIGRYVTRKETNVRESSLKKGAIIGENSEEFKERVRQHFDFLKTLRQENKNIKIWNVTHAYILTITSKYANVQLKDHLEYLDTLLI
jgi:broad specificity phosphatase PhoE